MLAMTAISKTCGGCSPGHRCSRRGRVNEEAASLYRTCRRHGETVRKLIDCLIAAPAIRADIPILHADADFDVLAATPGCGSITRS